MDLLQAYEQFYRQGFPTASFVRTLLRYDFSDYPQVLDRVCDLPLSPPNETAKLISNGSTAPPREYVFGPMSILPLVEGCVKTYEDTHNVWVNFLALPHQDDFPPHPHHLHHTTFNLKVWPKGNNLDRLDHFLGQVGRPVTLLSRPAAMLYLSGHERFLDMLDRRDVRCVSTSDWEPVYRKKPLIERGIRINDNMIDWSSGLNFYHCGVGRHHFLPIFHLRDGLARNLVNLADPSWHRPDDLVRLGGVVRCECGLPRVEMDVVPHHRLQPDGYPQLRREVNEAVELLTGRYLNLQFVVSENNLTILYSTDDLRELSHHDRAVLGGLHKVVRFRHGEFVRTGRTKMIPFGTTLNNVSAFGYAPKVTMFV